VTRRVRRQGIPAVGEASGCHSLCGGRLAHDGEVEAQPSTTRGLSSLLSFGIFSRCPDASAQPGWSSRHDHGLGQHDAACPRGGDMALG
jgi:hypothetical protein